MNLINDLNIPFELDHVGVAVRTLQEGEVIYRALGFACGSIELVPSEKVKVQMFELGNKSRIELLEPTEPDSPVGRFLTKRGPGVHHICLRVKGLRSILKRLKAKNIQLVNPEPVPGAHNCEVAFVHPRSTGGVLLELSEKRTNS